MENIVLDEIKELDDEQLKVYVKERIYELEEYAKNIKSPEDKNIIGYCVEINDTPADLECKMKPNDIAVLSKLRQLDYIPLNTKIVYQHKTDFGRFTIKNDGSYYYVDDDSYLYDFCKFIRGVEYFCIKDILDEIYYFINDYFKNIELISRHEMNHPIYRNKYSYYEPIEEHKFTSFKGKGNAMCTEIALMTQNILAFIGYEPYYLIGQCKLTNCDSEYHAFNIMEEEDEETKEPVVYLIDCSIPVNVYDISTNLVGRAAYVKKINKPLNEFFQDLIGKENGIEIDSYCYRIIGNHIFTQILNGTRNYSQICNETDIIRKKIKEEECAKIYTYNNNIR